MRLEVSEKEGTVSGRIRSRERRVMEYHMNESSAPLNSAEANGSIHHALPKE
jgi:hypothetical protein